MTDIKDFDTSRYYEESRSWAGDRERQRGFLMRLAWAIAGVASLIAIAEAIAIATLTPLKSEVPYTILVDRQTGNVEALRPFDQGTIAPDQALTRSLLAQYVIAREGFAIESLKQDYRKVALWSAGSARAQYVAEMQASNPSSPLAALPRQAIVEVQIRSLSSLGPNSAMIRYVKTQIDPGGRRMTSQPWSAVVTYRFSGAAMSQADRLINPLGFQVIRFRRDAEIPLENYQEIGAQPPPARTDYGAAPSQP
jgi:type IV secretion system protein VirB8